MKLTRKMVLISIILLAAYATPVSAEVGDLLMSTGYKSLDVGESWNLEEGYVITIKQIDKEGNKIWLVLSKYNSQVDSEVLSSGETYIYEKEIGSKEYTILQANVGEIDKESRTVRFDSVRQYSDGGVADIASPLPVIANFKNETYSSGTAIVHGTWLFDLDTGGEVGHSERNAADFWWEQATKEIRYLVPQNGAKLANMGIVDINSVDCSHARYSESKIAGSINNNKIPVGTVICVKTNLGNYAKFRIDEYGYDLEISWVCQAVQTSATTASSTVKLISPLNGVVMDNGRTDRQDSVVWDFDWSDAKSANRYQLYVKGSGAEIPIIDTITTSSSYHYVGSGSYIVDRNRYGWTWKVRAQVNGRWGGWSETRNFQVEKVNTDQHSQTVTQPTSASTSARTPATTRHAIPVATFANSTSQQNKTSKIFLPLIILGLLCVVGYVLVRSSPEGGRTAKLIDAVKYKYYGSDYEGMQMSNRNAILLPDKKFGGALGGAICGAIITVVIWNIAGAPAVAAIGGIIVGLIGGAICGTVAAMAEEDHATAGATAGGIGSAVLAGVLIGITEGFWDGLWGFISCGIAGAIMGGLVGSVGNWTGGVTNKMREKQLQYRKTVPGLFDTAKDLSTEANTLFKQGNYPKALQTYNDALDNFNKASNGALATGDVNLVSIITNNTTTIEENIVTCKNLVGTRITEEAKNRFEIGNFKGALQSYQEALKYLKDPDLVAKANDSIEICYREIDVDKVEELSNRAVSLLNEATSINESFKARDMLKQADDIIDEAVAIAMKRNFTEAHQQLNTISKNIRTQRGVIDDRMAGGGEVVSGDYDIGTIVTKTGPSIPTVAPEHGSIEIKRGYEVMSNNDLRFGIHINNNTDYLIADVETILDYPELFNSKEKNDVMRLGNIDLNGKRTAKYTLTPLGCIHNEKIDATIIYKDHIGKRHTVPMRPKEVHCVCPFLKEKPMREGEFAELSAKGKYIEEGLSFSGISTSKIADFIKESCMHRLHIVGEHAIDNTIVLYLAGESIGEKAYYLLTTVIQPYADKDITQIALRAYSDKSHGLHGFLNEITHSIHHLVGSVQSAKEIGIIENKQVINIIDSVVQRTSFGGIGDGAGASSVNIRDSVLQRSQIGSTRRCPNCDAEVQADAKFCTECRAKLAEAEVKS